MARQSKRLVRSLRKILRVRGETGSSYLLESEGDVTPHLGRSRTSVAPVGRDRQGPPGPRPRADRSAPRALGWAARERPAGPWEARLVTGPVGAAHRPAAYATMIMLPGTAMGPEADQRRPGRRGA